MDPKLRQVTRWPLTAIWDENGIDLDVQRVRYVGADDIRAFLRSGYPFAFVVVQKQLRWIRGNDRFDFWKTHLQPHLREPEDDPRVSLEDFPDELFYWASEWRAAGEDGAFCVLCEPYH
ncbi:MAG TPA: hypothetical protein VGP69_16715 [Gaiellaceae bacterium]|nr:hypothetical protein [Gaiellaceae bacterium]